MEFFDLNSEINELSEEEDEKFKMRCRIEMEENFRQNPLDRVEARKKIKLLLNGPIPEEYRAVIEEEKEKITNFNVTAGKFKCLYKHLYIQICLLKDQFENFIKKLRKLPNVIPINKNNPNFLKKMNEFLKNIKFTYHNNKCTMSGFSDIYYFNKTCYKFIRNYKGFRNYNNSINRKVDSTFFFQEAIIRTLKKKIFLT